jgi:chorismate mutase
MTRKHHKYELATWTVNIVKIDSHLSHYVAERTFCAHGVESH